MTIIDIAILGKIAEVSEPHSIQGLPQWKVGKGVHGVAFALSVTFYSFKEF